MRNGLILSVVIPTYNRVKFLETTAAIFISQIIAAGLADQVEIVIGNDASSDGTREYLNQLQPRHKFIKVLNHSKNLGVSGNIESIIAAARGEYIWGFGEDDLIIDGSVGRILESISSGVPNYLLINTKNIISLDDSNKKYEIVGGSRLNIQKDVWIDNFESEADKLLKIPNWLYLTGLLSTMVFRKALFLDWLEAAKKRVREENVYLYQAPLIMGIARLGKLNIIATPLILHRKNENHWSKSVYRILTVNLYDSSEISDIIKEYMSSEYAGHRKRFAAFVLATILEAKKNGIVVNKYIFDALKRNYNCYPYNLRFLVVLLIPSLILRRLPF